MVSVVVPMFMNKEEPSGIIFTRASAIRCLASRFIIFRVW